MSGPKEADVQFKLDKAQEIMRRRLEQALGNQQIIADSSKKAMESSRKEVSASLAGLTSKTKPPDEVKKYAPEEWTQALKLLEEANRCIIEGDSFQQQAMTLEKEGDKLHSQAEAEFKRAERIYREVKEALRYKEGSLHEEDRQASEARAIYERSADLEAQATGKLQQSSEKVAAAKGCYDKAARLCHQAESAVEVTKNLARSRREAEEEARRVKEEKRKKAGIAIREIKGWAEVVKATNHTKFAPGEFDRILEDIRQREKDFTHEDYDQILKTVPGLIERLRTLEGKVREAEERWRKERQDTLDVLEVTKNELSIIDREFVKEWTKRPHEVDNAYREIESANRLFDQEQFQECQKKCLEAVKKLKGLNEELRDGG